MKCTLTHQKQQRILCIQKQNYILEQQLHQLSTQHEATIKQIQNRQLQHNNLHNFNQLQAIRNQMLKKNLSLLSVQDTELTEVREKIQAKWKQLKAKNQEKQLELFELNKEKDERERNKGRMKEQCRAYKTISQANTNIVKVYENLKKTHQNMLRNLNILQEQLKSKNKYLQILQKKERKQNQQKQEKKKPSEVFIPKRQYKPSQKTIEPKENVNDNKKLKQYNDLIRKKNMILLSK